MSTNVRVKKITTASNEAAGRSNVYHDVFKGEKLISSTLVGKLRKTRGVDGYKAFVMNKDGSRRGLGLIDTRSGAAHAARKAYMKANGLAKAPKAAKAKTAKAKTAKSGKTMTDDEKREARNARKRELRAAKKAANG